MQAPFYLEFVPNHVLDAPPGTGYMARAKPEDRALDYPNQVGPHACSRITRQLTETRRYPIRKVTTPVPVEGG
jgi:hypothetical protein